MPRAPTELRILSVVVQDDLQLIRQHNPDHAERIVERIEDWRDNIQWGRVPQEHLRYLSGSDTHNYYRERVGNSGYRIVYEISDDRMTAVAVFPKDDNAYDIDEYDRRMGRS